MRVLGLDLSLTCTGIAVVGDDLQAMSQPNRAARPPKGMVGMARLCWLADEVRAAVEVTGPDRIAIEGYSFGARGNAVFQLGELGGIVRYVLHTRGYSFVEVPAGEWRKQLFGRGNLPKDEVRVEAFKRYGVEFASLDVLEAWCVATAVLRREQGLDKPEPKRRRRAAA